jgi:hypothetical protein
MTKRPGRNHSLAFKAKVAVVAIKGEKRLIELAQDIDVKTLHAKIGELTQENDFFARRARQGGSVGNRKKMIKPTAKLNVGRQAKVLRINRGSVYYKPQPVAGADLKLMHRIDKLHMEFPFAGTSMPPGGDGYIIKAGLVMKISASIAVRTSARGKGAGWANAANLSASVSPRMAKPSDADP